MQDEHFKALFDTQKSTYENALKVDGPDSPTVLWLIDIWDMQLEYLTCVTPCSLVC